jgi:signal peptidase I
MVYLAGIDVTEGIIVSFTLLIVLGVFYLYKKENKLIMRLIVSQYKPHPAELEKDTRFQDWILLIAMLCLITVFGLKLVTFAVVVSDSMKPEFQRGDMILTQSFNIIPTPGDIVSFKVPDENNPISHRVMSVSGGKVITRGDNNGYTDGYDTKLTDVTAKAIIFNNHPIVIKNLGALFITDYAAQGVIYKWGDKFTFMQQLSATMRAWGYVITILAVLAYLFMMKTK